MSKLQNSVLIFNSQGYLLRSSSLDSNIFLIPDKSCPARHYMDVMPHDLSMILKSKLLEIEKNHVGQILFEYQNHTGASGDWLTCSLHKLVTNDEALEDGFCFQVSNNAVVREIFAKSYNKEQMLIASANANKALLENRDIVLAISTGLRQLGQAMEVDRSYLFTCAWNRENNEMCLNQLLEWNGESAEPQINNPELQNVPLTVAQNFTKALLEKKHYACKPPDLPEGEEKDLLVMQGTKSLLALPIFVEEKFWGFVGFDDCQSGRDWSESSIFILSSFATSISTALIRKKIEDDLVLAKIQAEQANYAKSQFLSNITHEIRTPLHGVIGNAELLSSHQFNSAEAEYFQNLRLSANTLYGLINNILDLSRIEAGVFELSPDWHLVSDIISSARASVSWLLKTSTNELDISIDSNLPSRIFVDSTYLTQILVNLLSNSIKFSDNGKVVLTIYRVDEGVRFSVSDNGIGMSTEQQLRLFSPFTQFDSSLSKKYQGSGLGLSIVRHLLKKMNSEPEVITSENQGTTFSFALPVTTDAPVLVVKTPQSKSSSVPRLVKRILIVEDNRINMLLAKKMITDSFPEIEIHTANDGANAIGLLDSGIMPDLILMDLQMPNMDGFETTRQIRRKQRSPLRIVALTASALSQIKNKCLEVGMDDFLVKPFSAEQISRVICYENR